MSLKSKSLTCLIWVSDSERPVFSTSAVILSGSMIRLDLATDPSGNLVKNLHWTAEPGKNLREIAKAVGKEDMYISLYATNSKFVHGSNIVSNLYRDDKMQLHFNGRPDHCARMAILTCQFWLETIEAHFAYFGIPFQQNDLRLTKQNISVAMSKYM